MRVDAHPIERAKIERHLKGAEKLLSATLGKRSMGAGDLSGVVDDSWVAAAARARLDGPAAETVASWRRFARAGASLFVTARAPAGTQVGVPLESRIVTAPAPASSAHASLWLRVTWAAIAVADEPALWLLLATPAGSLTPPGVVPPPWAVPLAEAVQRIFTNDPEASSHLLRAVEATDPQRMTEPRVADNALDVAAPGMEALYRLLAGDHQAFAAALEKALVLHKKHWERRPDETEGWVALFPLAVARLARERGVPVEVESGYLPATVLDATASPVLMGCPYCLSPIDEQWPSCACCREALGNDAPVELAPGELASMNRKPCVACGRRIPELGVRCATCRARQ